MDISPRRNDEHAWESQLVVQFKYKRKYEKLVLRMEELAREELLNNSIFKGKAIDSDFEFINPNSAKKPIYSLHEREQLEANIFTVLREREGVKSDGVPIRRTILLHGMYGTGKTLTLLEAARVAVSNGWTYIQVKPGHSIEDAIVFARKYQPALLSFEDIDVQASGDRSERLNKILNEVDGLFKDSEVLTILTTNRIDYIAKGMLRPGRIDLQLEMGRLDKDAVVDLIRGYGGDNIAPDLDEEALWKEAFDYPPAFVTAAVDRAKLYRRAFPTRGNGKIASQHLEAALRELRPQYNKMMEKEIRQLPPLEESLGELVEARIKPIKDTMGITD
jgi:SpoVK/Ycf46/Vps4 family AAA+-type ATPase